MHNQVKMRKISDTVLYSMFQDSNPALFPNTDGKDELEISEVRKIALKKFLTH